MACLILQTLETDPCRNLAVEEFLFSRVAIHPVTLFLWQAHDAVIIGKNQNPWLECNPSLIEKEGGRLVRRLSGGGTVYQDTGNLNYAFIARREAYDRARQFRVVTNALRRFDVAVEIAKNHALMVKGRKISGNAFCLRKAVVLHHGTLLISADLSKLHRWLQPAVYEAASRMIRSIPSPVMNLTEEVPSLNAEKMKEALRESFRAEYDAVPVTAGDEYPDPPAVEELRKKYASREWCYGLHRGKP